MDNELNGHEAHESQDTHEASNRRNFLRLGLSSGLGIGLGAAATMGLMAEGDSKGSAGSKVKLMSPDGKIVEVDSDQIVDIPRSVELVVREGVPNRKFVMVIDLSRCKNARKCKNACSKMHYLPPERSYIKVEKMQDAEKTAPYWMPTPCFHCDNPPCVKVCPVDATFKTSDGIVSIDNTRCIGCRFCMVACPYSARIFNWGTELYALNDEQKEAIKPHESCSPHLRGTVEKCDFCPNHTRHDKLPDCVKACPNGVFYFGDELDDTVSNGDETLRLSKLLKDKSAYRYLEDLGTKPRVYYLPPVNRLFPFVDPNEHPEKEHHE